MTDKEKIKVEIERLKESGCASPIVICDTLLSFIDSLQEEPVSDDLDIAIGEYCSNPDNFITYIDVAFAYRSEQKDDIPLIIKAIKFGANWQKQQMMKNAVKVEVWDEKPPHITYFSKNLKGGDKVKLITIKEE